MCDQVSEHIEQLEAEVASLRLLCDNQRKALESIYIAFDNWNKKRGGYGQQLSKSRELAHAILTARSASTMTGTDESGG